jgi:hypothetical protein
MPRSLLASSVAARGAPPVHRAESALKWSTVQPPWVCFCLAVFAMPFPFSFVQRAIKRLASVVGLPLETSHHIAKYLIQIQTKAVNVWFQMQPVGSL